ncbi:hypothetical protein PR048_004813 [Dryococelus australis]|uniref:HTH CENPB-type domain-containing protein n=1 Tax=Dryococelus australis TaxID=614101 RepID=A0ABQ9I6F8_9NEOP|nr:hypothetical protein PR048_004813 [Dryococelus australis]
MNYKECTKDTRSICIKDIRVGNITQQLAKLNYGIPRIKMNYKLQKEHQKNIGEQPVFSIEEENAFVSCLEYMSTFGFPVTTSGLVAVIACYLNKIGRKVSRFKEGINIGSHWVNGFLGRHKELLLRNAAHITKPLTKQKEGKNGPDLPKSSKWKRINVVPGKSMNGDVLATEDDGAVTSSAKRFASNRIQQRKSLTLDEEEEN